MLQLNSDQPAFVKAIGAEFDGDDADNDTSRKLRTSPTAGKGSITPRNAGHHGGPPAPAELKRKWTGLRTIGQICRRRELPDGTELVDLRTSSAAWLRG